MNYCTNYDSNLKNIMVIERDNDNALYSEARYQIR